MVRPVVRHEGKPRSSIGSWGSIVRAWASCLAALVLLGAATLGAACGGAPPAAEKAAPRRLAASNFDPCEGSDPVWRPYKGPLKRARCDQDMFLTMAGIADQMGATCDLCHAEGGKDFDYPKMTDMKKVGLWMDHYFMEGLKERDGSPMQCKSCHVDKNGKPAAKFLGEPRDIPWTVEWMTTVMTNRFVLPDGSKLKCKHCHTGTWGTPQFKPKIVMAELPFMAPPPSEFYAEPPPAPSAKPPAPPPPPDPPPASSSPVPAKPGAKPPAKAPLPASSAKAPLPGSSAKPALPASTAKP